MLESYFIYIGFLLLFFIILIFFKKSSTKKSLSLDDLCVIIPFRNEESNLQSLFHSLICQKKLPKNIIFVNDHSTDKSAELVKGFITKNGIGKLLELPKNYASKKKAIRYAVSDERQTLAEIESQYYLTIDADVSFDAHFFSSLINNPADDMVIRPVIMKSNSFLGRLFSTEHLFFNALNFILSPIYILSASGANLVFKKTVFNRVDSYEKHKYISSGDDYFLLRDFQKDKATISISKLKEDAVYTNGPKNTTEYFNQRIRWLSKSKKSKNVIELFIGINLLFYFLGGFVIVLYLLVSQDYLLFIYLFIARFIIDVIVFLNYSYLLKEYKKVIFLPFFQLIYPLLFLMVIFGSMFYSPLWKGRR